MQEGCCWNKEILLLSLTSVLNNVLLFYQNIVEVKANKINNVQKTKWINFSSELGLCSIYIFSKTKKKKSKIKTLIPEGMGVVDTSPSKIHIL